MLSPVRKTVTEFPEQILGINTYAQGLELEEHVTPKDTFTLYKGACLWAEAAMGMVSSASLREEPCIAQGARWNPECAAAAASKLTGTLCQNPHGAA